MIYEDIKNYIEQEPKGRERRNRDRAMVNLLLVKYPILTEVPKDKLVDFAHDFESYTRIWRQVLSENINLRGLDYDTKRIVEENYQMNLGYTPGFEQSIRKLKTI